MKSWEERIRDLDAPGDVLVKDLARLPDEELRRLSEAESRDIRSFLIGNMAAIRPALGPDIWERAYLHDRDSDNRLDALSLLAEAEPSRAGNI